MANASNLVPAMPVEAKPLRLLSAQMLHVVL